MLRLLRIMSEPELYLEQLLALEDVRQKINATLAGKERLAKVDALEAKAKADTAKAAKQLQEADVLAQEILSEAKAEADRTRVELEAQVQAVRAELSEERVRTQEASDDLVRRANDLESFESQLARREKALSEGEATVAALQADYEEKAQKLRDAMR